MKKDDAQSRLERSQPFIGQKTTFLKEYPQVTELNLEVQANPMGFGETQTYHFSLDHPPGQYCTCPNRHCTGGGFDIGWFLQDLISKRLTEGQTGGPCIGSERTSRRDFRTCFYSFQVKASLKYVDDGKKE